jgi:hypothetical protein
MSSYTFVCIDESDELISSFVLAETGTTLGFSSHVRKHESQWGLYALQQIYNHVKYVYMLDGTATKVSQQLANSFLILDQPVQVYHNTWQRVKAPIYMLNSVYEARKLALDAVKKGLKTVIAVDTKEEARLLYEYILEFDLALETDIIMITGDTHNSNDVRAFFTDVEQGAHDKQVVIYNSAMGSGVSIVETCPAVFVQICKHLSPRKNLQLLNRYRQQSVVYCYTQQGENLYHTSVDDRLKTVNIVIDNEKLLTGLDYETRSYIADVTTDLARLSVIDEYEQRRSYRDFYIGLLKKDGREVHEPLIDTVIGDDFKQNFSKARALIDAQKEQVLTGWRSIEPINRDNRPPDDITLLDYARGILHTQINNFIPENENLDIDDYELAKLVTTYSKNVRFIERYLQLSKALTSSIRNSKNDRDAITTFKVYMSRLEAISQVGLIMESSDSSKNLVDIVPDSFLHELDRRKYTYNLIAKRQDRSYEYIIKKFEHDKINAALSISKMLLKPFGLKLKRTNGKRDRDGNRQRVVKITGNKDIIKLLKLRGFNIDKINFDIHKLIDYSTQIKPLISKYVDLSIHDQNEVMERLKDSTLTFEESIELTDVLF